MGRLGIAVLALALIGALASWIVGAVYYARGRRAAGTGGSVPRLAVLAWPFATARLAKGSDEAGIVNKALVALLVCLTLGATTISLSTNLNRVAH